MKSKKLFRSLFAEKLIELGNIIIAALVLSQFISDKKFSLPVFIFGIILVTITYIISYLIA
ncbi:hypothetical protein COT02_01580 [Candidatus Roizmanbacteria bacterium CG07_land_8_20_14_0_80_34_15]|uniref:Uncharacterized protein n=1 Tax=Candidatus Roizmanbacteria bacterium CG07_land_8_20_14_0_80_34_15 TaxID=1974849 RepID=A0A2M6YUW9_9BACT|nr:MAG: hypothetical protein COT02_01580 [Candidatus Roizmanbacteria bacterium CG07_land_8_20_14_0_80_34_15]